MVNQPYLGIAESFYHKTRSAYAIISPMKSGDRHNGYTIVEVMIFLAVSAVLLASALLLISGQQQRAEFNTAAREFDSKLQSVIGNVASGYYNNTEQTTCTVSGGTITVNTGSGNFGQNSDCVFIGQWIGISSGASQATITSYAGLRRTGSPPQEVQSLADANPTPITDTVETYRFRGGNITATMKDIATNQALDTVAITTTFNAYNGGTLASGSSRVETHAINTATSLDITNPKQGIQICLTDGEQAASIVLNTGSTRVTIFNGSVCT